MKSVPTSASEPFSAVVFAVSGLSPPTVIVWSSAAGQVVVEVELVARRRHQHRAAARWRSAPRGRARPSWSRRRGSCSSPPRRGRPRRRSPRRAGPTGAGCCPRCGAAGSPRPGATPAMPDAVVGGGAQHAGDVGAVVVARVRADVGVAARRSRSRASRPRSRCGRRRRRWSAGRARGGRCPSRPGWRASARRGPGGRGPRPRRCRRSTTPGAGGERPGAVGRDPAVEPARRAREVPLLVGGVGQRAGVEERVVRRAWRGRRPRRTRAPRARPPPAPPPARGASAPPRQHDAGALDRGHGRGSCRAAGTGESSAVTSSIRRWPGSKRQWLPNSSYRAAVAGRVRRHRAVGAAGHERLGAVGRHVPQARVELHVRRDARGTAG